MGLLYHQTGIPVFLIFLRGIEKSFFIPLRSMTEVDSLIQGSTNPDDCSAWKLVRLFFENGGNTAVVCGTPLKGETSPEFLTCMLGKDEGFARRTGIYALKNTIDRADLVVVPQSGSLLTSEDYALFCQTLFRWISDQRNYFAIMDLPKNMHFADILPWADSLHGENAALYYPWLIRDQVIHPASPCIAAEYQLSDQEFHLGENPTNRKLRIHSVPLIKLHANQSIELQKHRINTVLSFKDAPALLWGARTLASSQTSQSGQLGESTENRFIATRRTLKALSDSISSICDHFVLEPLRDATMSILQNELDDFCSENKYLFNTSHLKPYQISVSAQDKSQQQGILVECGFYLNTCIESLQLSIGVDL